MATFHPLNMGADSGDPAEGVRAGRIPLRFAATGLLAFIAAAVLLLVAAEPLSRPSGWASPRVLGLTHLLALGFITSMVLGVLHQFLPASFQAPAASARIATAAWIGLCAAVVVFVTGLLTSSYALTAVGGAGLGCALTLSIVQLAAVMARGKRRTTMHLFHVTALAALLVVVVLGVLLAVGLRAGWFTSPLSLLAPKIVLALDGWLGMITVGVSWHTVRLLNASSRAPRHVGAIYCAMATTVCLAPIALALNPPVAWRIAAMVPYALGAILYCQDVVVLVWTRRDRHLGVTPVGHVLGAAVFVATALAAIPAAAGVLPWPQIAVSSALIGWAPILIVANGNRILPVLVSRRFRSGAPLPLDRSRLGALAMRAALALLAAAWLLLEIGILLASTAIVQLAAALLIAGSGALLARVGARVMRARRRAAIAPAWLAAKS